MSSSGSGSRYTSGGSSGFSAGSAQSLMIDVRASTQGFAQDIAAMRSSFDGTLVSSFTQAGSILDAGLTTAIKRGVSGFGDLRTIGLQAISEIATQAANSLLLGPAGSSGGAGGLGFGSLVSSILGLPGRATGGPVSPGQAYMVGERGPEMFIPTAAGAISPNQSGSGPAREVRVSINVNTPAGGDAPQALQRSGRQIASAVRRALTQY